MEPLRARAAKLLVAARRERQQRFPAHRRLSSPVTVPTNSPTPVVVGAGKTVVLGRDDHSVPLALDEESRLRHMQVIGTTGSGKSNLFFQMARQDIENGRGVLFLDPHGLHPGSGYRQLIAWLAESGLGAKRVVHIVDPNAGTHCTGFNPLAVPPEHHPSVVAEAALECFQRLWGDEDPDTKPTIQRLLPAVLGALAERGLTLAEATSVLDPDDRDGLRAYLAVASTDDYAREELQWLQDIGLERGGRHDLRVEVTGPRNRVAKLVRLPALRTMVGQTRRVIDLRAAMDGGHIILANLSGGGLVYERAADLLGRLLLRFLVFHAKRRGRPERFFAVYADECQRYLTGDLPVALAELRKQGVALALGCQWQSQLAEAGDEVLSAVRNGTNIKIAFQLKDHTEAADLAEMLIPLNLEEPIAALNRETVVGYRIGRMRSGGITQSQGTSSGVAHSATDSTSVTRSEAKTVGSADTVSHSHTRSQSRTVGESETETVSSGSSETIGSSGSQTSSVGGSCGTSSEASTGEARTSNYDGAVASGLPDSNSVSSGSGMSDSTSSSSSWSEAEQSGWSEASTTSESASQSHGTFWSETEGEAETDGTAHTESRSTTEGTAHSQGRSTGMTFSSGKNAATAHTDGWSEALVPTMAMRPGGVHSKENQAYKAAQMLRSLPPGRCVINYVGPNGLETAMLAIPFQSAAPLDEESFARMRTALFVASPSAAPRAEAEANLRERRQVLKAEIDHAVLRAPADPEEFRIAAPKTVRTAQRPDQKPRRRS